jgi:predicted DNA-binding transcriptional regulator AlpA
MQHPLGLSTIDGRPLPQFHGRQYLRYNELVEIGLVTNRPTLKLLIARGLFPPPLKLSPRMLLWDVAEIAAVVERLRGERNAA